MPPVWARKDYLPGTASLIVNFAAALVETEIDDQGSLTQAAFDRTALDHSIHIDINRAWNLTAAGYILGQ
jgi:hypothetical protein